jgi:metallophosphoesterase superfamily enzyme
MISQLVVAGDLVESPRLCPATARDVLRLESWLADRDVRLQLLEGNHDVKPSLSPGRVPRASTCLPQTCMVGGWTIGHGHRPISERQRISGHHHPVFSYRGVASPCFLVGPEQIVLPAFSLNAAGCDVLSAAVPREWLAGSLRCLVSTGHEVLDFGPLPGLRRRLRRGLR